ncbi:MAG: alpha/beta hydrolase [Rhodomicrobiaceae bacterium]
MQLELLSAQPSGQKKNVSILFIHGVCLGAWCWEPHFLPFFAQAGYPAYALSLRGHGRSDGHERIQHWQLRDFADDLAWAMHGIDGPVIVAGHSMGGGVVQHYLRQGRKAAGVVLLASAPPHGLMRASVSMYQRNPTLWDELYTSQGKPISHIDLGIIENGLFSEPDLSPERMDTLRRLGQPAVRASLELMGWPPFAPLPWMAPPMMIVGGERDELIPPADVFLTGAYYGINPKIIPGSAHAIMLDTHWRQAAELITAWLERKFGGAENERRCA